MKALKVIGNCCLVFLAVIGVMVSIIYAYYHFFVKDTTIGVNYVGEQIPIDLMEKAEDLTEEEIDYYENRVLFNVNYYSNDKNNGIELQEMRLDYFTDYSLNLNACRSTGMQYLGDFETYTREVNSESEANRRVVEDFYYYDTTNMVSWTGGKVATQLNRNAMLIIKIDDRAFSLQLTGKYDTYGRLWGFLWNVKQSTTYYDYGDVFADVMNAVKSNSRGYGDYYITLDLSVYFTVNEYDTETGKYVADRTTDIIKNYAVLKFHYDENGARNSTQSLYGIIACNPSYDVEDRNVDTTYWQERMVYTLTNKDLIYRYSETYDGYFVSLSMDMKTLFADMPRAKVNVSINTQYNDYNIVGIDYNGFENFEIDTLTIKSTSATTFHLMDKSLSNTSLQKLKHSNNITFDIAENAVDSEYSEVIL